MGIDAWSRVIQKNEEQKQLPPELNAMNVDVHSQELAMAIFWGLASKFEHLIVAINAVLDIEKLTINFSKSHLLKDEQRTSNSGPAPRNEIDSALH